MREAGRGSGSALLRGVLDWLFAETDTNRVDLDLFVGNERAKRAYEKAGFAAFDRRTTIYGPALMMARDA